MEDEIDNWYNFVQSDDEETELLQSEQEQNPFVPGTSINEVISLCVMPVVNQMLLRLIPMFLILLPFGQVLQHGYRGHIMNLFSIISGICVLVTLVDFPQVLGTIVFLSSTYLYCYLMSRVRTIESYFFCLLVGLLYLVFREQIPLVGSHDWSQVRGIEMIGLMKAMSIGYQFTYDDHMKVPSIIQFLGFIFFPGTLVFGPWVSYSDHNSLLGLFGLPSNFKLWLKNTIRKLFSAFSYLVMSTCIFYWLFQNFESIYFLMVRDALMIRFSHYFISRLSEACCRLAGPRLAEDCLSVPVVEPFRIEFPRSLVEVVIYWNIPMHTWLKQHAYEPFAFLGKSKAALMTFLVSAMLHGLNFRLSAVLISIGLYCYIEYSVREKLAEITDSCVRARSCHICNHTHKTQLSVQVINCVFTLLSIFNLAYLGVMLDTTERYNEGDGFFDNINYDLLRWRELSYSSHYLMLGLFILNLCL